MWHTWLLNGKDSLQRNLRCSKSAVLSRNRAVEIFGRHVGCCVAQLSVCFALRSSDQTTPACYDQLVTGCVLRKQVVVKLQSTWNELVLSSTARDGTDFESTITVFEQPACTVARSRNYDRSRIVCRSWSLQVINAFREPAFGCELRCFLEVACATWYRKFVKVLRTVVTLKQGFPLRRLWIIDFSGKCSHPIAHHHFLDSMAFFNVGQFTSTHYRRLIFHQRRFLRKKYCVFAACGKPYYLTSWR